MRKIYIVLLAIIMSLSLNIFAFAKNSNLPKTENYNLQVILTDPNGSPASKVYVTLYSHLENKFVAFGYTDKNGIINLKYNPDEKLFDVSKNIQDIDLVVYAAPEDGDLAVHYLTKTYVTNKNVYTDEEINKILNHNVDSIRMEYNKMSQQDEFSVKVFQYLKKNNKISKEKPVYKFTQNDIRNIINGENNVENKKSSIDIQPLYDAVDQLGSFATVIGEVHSADGISSTFKYSSSSGVTIDVGVKSGSSSWSTGGSTYKSTGWDVTFPAFSTADTTGYGKYCKSYFRYDVGITTSYYGGITTYTVYAAEYNGGTEWGSNIYGYDGKSASVASSYNDSASYLPNSTATRSVSSGKKYSVAVAVPVVVDGVNQGTVSLGVTTNYQTSTITTFNFTNKYSSYHLYGANSGWKQVYVTNKQ